jgi:hypothetical protein
LAVTVILRLLSDLKHLLCRDPPHRNGKTDVIEAFLLLAEDAHMICVLRRSLIFPRGEKRSIDPTLKLAPKSLDAPVIDDKGQACFRTRFPRSVIAKNKNDVTANRSRFVWKNKKI